MGEAVGTDAAQDGIELWPRAEDLERVFELKYGAPEQLGWAPRMRRRFGHFNPDEHYEALLSRLVLPSTGWLDVGCGHDLFPSNRALARELADRCRLLVGVDPDPALDRNPFVHEKIRAPIDRLETDRRFDLVTMRMVAEHVAEPRRVAAVLARVVAPGGLLVIYTVNRWSPVPIMTRLLPFRLRQPLKRLLWRTDAGDTFPTRFGMNTRRRLAGLLGDAGFDEVRFGYLDDCRTLGRFRLGLWAELWLRRLLRAIGLRYPETCLLGVYRRRGLALAAALAHPGSP